MNRLVRLLGVRRGCVVAGGVAFSISLGSEVRLQGGGVAQSFGLGLHGQCGHGDDKSVLSPTPIREFEGEDVVQVAAAGNVSAFLTSAGEVFTCGAGQHGRLGQGNQSSKTTPDIVDGELSGEKVVSLACADRHMAALTDAGKLYVWGHGVGLGFADRKHREAPQQVVFDKSVAAISCGIYHSAAITSDGALWTFGSGADQQLGHGDKKNQWTPKMVEALKDKKCRAVACGRDFTIALTEDGEVYAFGADDYGSLGIGGGNRATSTSTPKLIRALRKKGVVNVVAGDNHAAAVTSSGVVYTWGHGTRQSSISVSWPVFLCAQRIS